ncbi:MAG: hypothetical protein QM791_02970 [Ferruginibacter sp.]
MPINRSRLQTWAKITVYFRSGTKTYNMALTKKPGFIAQLKRRKDVIDYHSETVRNFVGTRFKK